jgi:signal transduction histidine kinase
MADGSYDRRTGIDTDDEIGLLSASFDKMAEAVETRIKLLTKSVQQRDDFILALTHEIKTPITSILGYSERLRKYEPKPEQYYESIEYICREAHRMENLSLKLMQLIGLKSIGLKSDGLKSDGLKSDGLKSVGINMERFSVTSLFNSLEATLPQTTKNITTGFNAEGDLTIFADPVLIDDLLRNLILNAIQACSDNGIIVVSAEPLNNTSVCFTVKDNGKGLADGEIERITEPLYMADKSRSYIEGNSGLGLTICARITELHDTALQFESSKDVGTTVSFTLKGEKFDEQ